MVKNPHALLNIKGKTVPLASTDFFHGTEHSTPHCPWSEQGPALLSTIPWASKVDSKVDDFENSRLTTMIFWLDGHMAVCQNLVPLVNIKIAGKWMIIPLKMVLIGIDPYPYVICPQISWPYGLSISQASARNGGRRKNSREWSEAPRWCRLQCLGPQQTQVESRKHENREDSEDAEKYHLTRTWYLVITWYG